MKSDQSNRIFKSALMTGFSLCGAFWLHTAGAAGGGLPADFPIPPSLGPCKPVVVSGETICEWHNVDQHALYMFFLVALPKAGYTLLPGALEVDTQTFHMAAIGFSKGNAKGALTINGARDLVIQFLPGS